MGRYLDSWIENELPKLSMMLGQPRTMGPPQQQPEGAMTFPSPPTGSSIRGYETDPNGLPSSWQNPRTTPTMLGDFRPESARQPVPQTPTFGQPVNETPPNAASSFEVPQQGRPQERRRSRNVEDVTTTDDLFEAMDDDTVANGYRGMMQALGGEKGVNQAVQNATGRDPYGLSKREKFELLTEFGLRIASNSSGARHGEDLGSAIADAGAETLGSMRAIRANKEKAAGEEADRQLRRELMTAQRDAARRTRTQIKTDNEGNLRLIDLDDGRSRLVLDEKGNPVKAGGDGEGGNFVFQLQQQAYEGAFCQGLEGDALAACKKNALLFSKGGDVAELAFPEIRRQKRIDELMRFYADPDNSGVKLQTETGETKRWREMTNDERANAVTRYVDSFDVALASRGTGARSQPPSSDNSWGLSEEQLSSITEGKRARIGNGVYIARRNGQLVQVNEKGEPVE